MQVPMAPQVSHALASPDGEVAYLVNMAEVTRAAVADLGYTDDEYLVTGSAALLAPESSQRRFRL